MTEKPFQDGEEMHFVMHSDGNIYMATKEQAEKWPAANWRGSATIERVDRDSKTVWFSTPLPNGLTLKQ